MQSLIPVDWCSVECMGVQFWQTGRGHGQALTALSGGMESTLTCPNVLLVFQVFSKRQIPEAEFCRIGVSGRLPADRWLASQCRQTATILL